MHFYKILYLNVRFCTFVEFCEYLLMKVEKVKYKINKTHLIYIIISLKLSSTFLITIATVLLF